MSLNIYRNMENRLKINIRMFQGHISAFRAAAKESWMGALFAPTLPPPPTPYPILNSVKQSFEKINQE